MNIYDVNIIVMSIICTISLFVLAGICEFVRVNLLEKNIFKCLKNNKLLNKIDEKMNIGWWNEDVSNVV